jgi:5'-methylthioadenosine phosphorylase
MTLAKIGIIGGTGLYEIEGLTDIKEVNISTPFGNPSDTITIGNLNGVGLAFLPRHGRGHRILPSELPSRANVYALKSIGVEQVIAVNSCGSLKEEIKPGTLVIPDQLIDCTKGRVSTFFGEGIVAHISFDEPFCPELSQVIYKTALEIGASVRKNGTFIVMEGPAFSTKAESYLHRSWNADLIGMTVLPEAKLAREAEMCYASIACVTDYDCWREKTAAVTAEMIISNMRNNVNLTKDIIKHAITKIPFIRRCSCKNAMENAIVTQQDIIPHEQKEKLSLIIGKYI